MRIIWQQQPVTFAAPIRLRWLVFVCPCRKCAQSDAGSDSR